MSKKGIFVAHHIFILSFYFGVIGIFASTSAIGIHHLLMLLGATLFYYQDKKNVFASFKQVFLNKSFLFLTLFSISIILSVLSNQSSIDNPYKWAMKFKYFFIAVFSLPAILKIKWNVQSLKRLIYFCFFVVMMANISGFWGYHFGHNFLKPSGSITPDRLSGLNGMVLTYSHNLSFMNILLLGYLFHYRKLSTLIPLNRTLCVFIFLVNCICLYLSATRGAWLSLLIAIPFLYFSISGFKKWAFGSFIYLLSIFIFGSLSTNLKNEFAGEKRMDSNTQRVAFFKAALYAFKENPVLGVGYKQFELNVENIKKKYDIEWEDKFGHAHNNFLEHFASLGIFGGLSFILFSLFWFLEASRIKTPEGFLLMAFCVCLAVSGMTQYTFGDAENSVFIMLAWLLSMYLYTYKSSGKKSWTGTYSLR
ncbi:MAG: hypothetical protein CME61_07485 [Halobacteriovoraceae bacterium]|nr:hypothetical protein [Halobacteriovoraceae bacterium]